ncbi:hypothetical protein CsSME_00034474 [Camellia sinensis var. sinensis]
MQVFKANTFVELQFKEDTCSLMTMAMYVMHYQWIQSLVAALEKESNLLVMDATLLRSAATHTNFVFHAARTLQKYSVKSEFN